ITSLPRPVMKTNCSIPASRASSTAYWTTGLSTTGSISFGTALVAGRKRVPIPATGKTALRTGRGLVIGSERRFCRHWIRLSHGIIMGRTSTRALESGAHNMRILLTGGAGFIGSHATEALLGREHEVTAVDNVNTYYDPA